jgi:uncharacterized protein YoxC
MKFTQFLSRFVILAYICGVMLFGSVLPAVAAQSNLKKGLEQLPNIQTKAEDITKASPYGIDKVIKDTNGGLNEVQGTADFDRMKRGANGDTLPAVRQVEKAIDQVGNKLNSAKDDTQNKIGSALNQVGDKVGDTANYVKDKAGDAMNSVTEKASNTAESIKEGAKSLVDGNKAIKAVNSSIKGKAEDTPESIRFNNVRAFEKRSGDFRDRTTDIQTR